MQAERRVTELLPVLDHHLNDLMHALYRNRQLLTRLQEQSAGAPASVIAGIGEVLVSVREQERTLMHIQERLESIRTVPEAEERPVLRVVPAERIAHPR